MVPPLPIFTFWENVPPHFTVFCCLHPNFCSFKCVGAIRLKIRKKKDDDDDDNNKYLPDLPAHQKQRNIRIHWMARSLMLQKRIVTHLRLSLTTGLWCSTMWESHARTCWIRPEIWLLMVATWHHLRSVQISSGSQRRHFKLNSLISCALAFLDITFNHILENNGFISEMLFL